MAATASAALAARRCTATTTVCGRQGVHVQVGRIRWRFHPLPPPPSPAVAAASRVRKGARGAWRRYNNGGHDAVHGSSRRGSGVLWLIVGANSLVYGGWQVANTDRSTLNSMIRHFTLSAESLINGRFHTLVTSIFSQAQLDHFIANMVTLIFFGLETIQLKGVAFFSRLYFMGGILGGLGFVAWDLAQLYRQFLTTSELPERKPRSVMGASAAISALLTWKILTSPTEVLYIWMIIPVPAILVGIGYVGYDVYQMYKSDESSTVAHSAHVLGAVVGASFWLRHKRGMRL